MAYPQQTFQTIQSLLNYINTYVITNGSNAITGVELNNVVNSLASFIQSYSVNAGLATICSQSGGSAFILPTPIVIFTQVPTSIQWPGNVQNEYYMDNCTSSPIPLTNGFTYTDQFGTGQTVIPARTAIHIAKAINGTWFQVNNLSGSGGGGSLPPVTGHAGQFLMTDGAGYLWADPVVFITNSSFSPDGVTVALPGLVNNHFDIFFDTLAGFIYVQDGQWSYVSGGGFKLLIPGINANTQQLRLHLFVKGINS